MISFGTVLQAVLPIFLIVISGVVMKRVGVLAVEMEKGLLKLVIHFLYPCLILDKVLGNELLRKEPAVVAWGIGAGLGVVLVGFLVAYLVGGGLGMKKGTGRRSFTLAAGVQNFGYTAIPVLLALFVTNGEDGPVLGVLFVHSLGVEVALWIVGVLILTGSPAASRKYLINGPIVAVVVGLFATYTGLWRLVDAGNMGGAIFRQSMSALGQCAIPMALLLIGMTLADLVGKERLDWKVASGGVLVRNGLMALVILAFAKWLPIVEEFRQVLVVQAAMPSAMTPILMTRMFNARPQVAAQVVVATSLMSLLTMPIIVALGVAWVFGGR